MSFLFAHLSLAVLALTGGSGTFSQMFRFARSLHLFYVRC